MTSGIRVVGANEASWEDIATFGEDQRVPAVKAQRSPTTFG